MAKKFLISRAVENKLKERHDVTTDEVYECFMNIEGPAFKDTRAEHDTDPPTMWFVASTDRGRRLKVVYIEREESFSIKTAYEPKDGSDELYKRLCEKQRPLKK